MYKHHDEVLSQFISRESALHQQLHHISRRHLSVFSPHHDHNLALFPGSCAWAEKKKSLVHDVCASSVSPGFLGILETSVKSLHYTNLRETCQLFSHVRCLPLTMLCVDNDEGAIKPISSSLTRIVMFRPFQLNPMAHDHSLWSLPIVLNKAMQTVDIRAILCLTSKPLKVSHRQYNSAVWPFSR